MCILRIDVTASLHEIKASHDTCGIVTQTEGITHKCNQEKQANSSNGK